MVVEVGCRTCGIDLGRVEMGQNSPLASALLILAHAALPHNDSHDLELKIDGQDVKSLVGQHSIALRCHGPLCRAKPEAQRELVCSAPAWLVSALVVSFHSAHEGHPLEVVVDGVKWWPR